MHTAHIKRRRDWGIYERRDLANVMGACVLCCDALFEYGYLYVSDDGVVMSAPSAGTNASLKEQIIVLNGRTAWGFDEASRPYFAWHRQHVASVVSA